MANVVTSRWLAPAKLNLFLHILDLRTDSYHNLETVFQFLDFGDELIFTRRDDKQINLLTPILGVPNEQNLIMRAAEVLVNNADKSKLFGVDIELRKHIPMGGGMGGGSSDAATTMLALNHMWGGIFSKEQLLTLALQVGADVPVFISGQACFAEGIGELMTPCEPPENWFLILTPKVQVNTGKIFSHPELTRNTKSLRIRAPLTWDQLADYKNDCETVVRKLYPEVDSALKWLSNHGLARLTGTGASVFSPFKSEQEARKIAALVPEGYDSFVARACNQSGGIKPLSIESTEN
jgi:4-diphosphocytidyl-2-C-methyl-D-erythritol kinase